MSNIIAIIQARMNSTRLPGKVMKIIHGKSLLEHLIYRLQHSKELNDIIIATTESPDCKPIVDLCKKLGLKYFQGDEENVLLRYYLSAVKYKAEVIVRITSDCPVFDPTILDKMIIEFKKSNVDYLSNNEKRTFPRGCDAEIFTFKALELAYQNASTKREIEHVTPYITNNKDKFSYSQYLNNNDYSHYRLTVDEIEDLELIKIIYDELNCSNKIFYLEDIISLFEKKPELININKHIKHKTEMI